MILKTYKSMGVLILAVLMITITTIAFYVMVNNSTTVPKSATLVEMELKGGGFYG